MQIWTHHDNNAFRLRSGVKNFKTINTSKFHPYTVMLFYIYTIIYNRFHDAIRWYLTLRGIKLERHINIMHIICTYIHIIYYIVHIHTEFSFTIRLTFPLQRVFRLCTAITVIILSLQCLNGSIGKEKRRRGGWGWEIGRGPRVIILLLLHGTVGGVQEIVVWRAADQNVFLSGLLWPRV